MKFAMMGTGGVGGVFGARLAQAGEDVTFIARGGHLQAIKEKGLRVQGGCPTDMHIHPACATSAPAEVGVVDYIFVSVKLWDTEAAARSIMPMIGEDTAVISLQNGVTKDTVLGKYCQPKHIVGGVSYVAANIAEPGVIEQRGARQKLVFGEYSGAQSQRLLKLAEACQRAHIEAVVSDNIERDLWEKFIVLIAMSAVTAATRLTIGPVRSDPYSRALLLDAMTEAASIARAKGIPVAQNIVEKQIGYLDKLSAEVSSSMHHSIEHGDRLELPWLSGAVVEMGQEHNLPTPTNKALLGVLMPHVLGRNSALQK